MRVERHSLCSIRGGGRENGGVCAAVSEALPLKEVPLVCPRGMQKSKGIEHLRPFSDSNRCARALRRSLFRFLGAQGAKVSSFVVLAPSIWLDVLQGDRGRRRGNLQNPVYQSKAVQTSFRAREQTQV